MAYEWLLAVVKSAYALPVLAHRYVQANSPFYRATEAGNSARNLGQTYLVQLQPKDFTGDPAARIVHELYYADTNYIAPPTGSLPNQPFEGRVLQPLRMQWAIPVVPEGERRVALESVDIEIIAADGAMDSVIDTSDIGGRGVQVLFGLNTYKYDDFQAIFSGTAVLWSRDFSKLTITARDKGYLLDKFLQTNIYGGTGGIDGGPDNASKPKPVCFGKVRNIQPVTIDTANLVYQINWRSIAAVDAVYDKGAPLTFDADYADYASLIAATISSGYYGSCLALGLIRAGAEPAGRLTVDCQGDNAGGYLSSTAPIAKRVLTDLAGVDPLEIDTDAFGLFNTAVSGLIGWFQGSDPITAHGAMSAIIGHCSGWWGVTPAGLYTVGRVEVPSSTDIAEDWQTYDFEDVSIIDPPSGAMPPRWRQNVGYARNWTVQPASELAGAVGADRVATLSNPYLVTSASDTAIQSTFLLAQDSAILPSLFDSVDDALVEANRLLILLGTARQCLRIEATETGLRVPRGATIAITSRRINGGARKSFRYIGAEIDASKRDTNLILWG